MTLSEFLERWNGEFCEVAGSANAQNQCVDCVNEYIKNILGFPIIEWTNAKDFPSKAGDLYDWIPNTPTGVPLEGDLVVWGNSTAGHIAIFLEGNTTSFTSFDQNYPLGSPCHVQGHTYSNVIGWMRAKAEIKDTMWENIKNFLSEKKVPVEQAESKIRAWWESDSKLLQRTIDYENTKTGLEEKIRKLEEVVTDDHDWADVADGLERRLKVLVFEMQEMGESVTKESEPGALVEAFKRLTEVKVAPVVVQKKCLWEKIMEWLKIK